MCICLWPEFECPEVTLCGWQDIKIQLLVLLPICTWWLCLFATFIQRLKLIKNLQKNKSKVTLCWMFLILLMTQSHSTNITQQVRGVKKVKLIKTSMNSTPNGLIKKRVWIVHLKFKLIKTGMNSTPKGQANQNKRTVHQRVKLIKTGMNSIPKGQANQNRYEQYTERSS